MSQYNTKSHPLTSHIQPLDNQQEEEDGIFHSKYPFIYLICGKRGSGKSSLLIRLLSTPHEEGGLAKCFKNIILFSTTAANDPKYDELVSELQCEGKFFTELTHETLEQAIDLCKQEPPKKTKKKKKAISCIIFDDMISQIPSNRSKKNELAKLFSKLVVGNRHYKIALIITTQRLLELNPLIRSQADIVSFYRSDNNKEDKCFEETYSVTSELLNFCTKEHHSFITKSFLKGTAKIYKKFDEVVNNI